MSLDGGYIGSIDHALANLHIGRNQGREQGLEEGREEGYRQGHRDGYTQGWNKAVDASNQKLDQLHAEANALLAAAGRDQDALKEKLHLSQAIINALTSRNTQVEKADSALRETIRQLREENTRLRRTLSTR